jgi:hypothetical protein
MSKLEQIERQIEELSVEELAQLRAWFSEFAWVVWDRQLAAGAEAATTAF